MRIARNIMTTLLLSVMGLNSAMAESPAEIARKHHQASAATIVSDFRDFLSFPNVASNVSDMSLRYRSVIV